MLGGGSSNPDSNFEEIIRLAEYLKRKTEKPLYLMSLPPKDLDIIPKLYEAGISEIAFNIEIFQETWALRYMPGKGKIPRSYYYEALEKAVSLWGHQGNVRSMVILGLEPERIAGASPQQNMAEGFILYIIIYNFKNVMKRVWLIGFRQITKFAGVLRPFIIADRVIINS